SLGNDVAVGQATRMPIILSPDWDSHMISIIAKKMPSDKAKQWEIQAGHMFFKHRRATYHLRCIKECYAKCLRRCRPLLMEGNSKNVPTPRMLAHSPRYCCSIWMASLKPRGQDTIL